MFDLRQKQEAEYSDSLLQQGVLNQLLVCLAPIVVPVGNREYTIPRMGQLKRVRGFENGVKEPG